MLELGAFSLIGNRADLLMLVFELGDFALQHFERRPDVAVLLDVILGFLQQIFHLLQIAAGNAVMDGYRVERLRMGCRVRILSQLHSPYL
jgi:hypothetical protein